MKEYQKWECVECEKEWSTQKEAEECCLEEKTPKLVYECFNCCEGWETQEAAENCCPNADELWYCGECKNVYNFKDDAIACCTKEVEECEDMLLKRIWKRIKEWFNDLF